MSILMLYFLFLKIGVLTFGGGYALIPLFQDELVTRHAFLTTAEFADVVALAQITPGPVGLNCATYIGQQQIGWLGGIVASLGVLTPSLVLGIAVACFLKRFERSRLVAMLLSGIRPAALGMIAAAVFFFAETSIFTAPLSVLWSRERPFGVSWQGLLIFVTVLAVQSRWKLSLPMILGAAALAGALTMH